MTRELNAFKFDQVLYKLISISVCLNKFIMNVYSIINLTMLITHHKYEYLFRYIWSNLIIF